MTDELFLVAHIAGRGFAVAVAQVESVVEIGEIVPVPGAARGVAGLAALRSRVVTVVDTVAALDLPEAAARPSRAIITWHEGHLYALLVDLLEDVASFARLPVAAGATGGSAWRRATTGVIERDGEPLLVLDLAQLLPVTAAAA